MTTHNTPEAALAAARCEKCRGSEITVRWDAGYYDCLYKQQSRNDWTLHGGEHLHYQCSTCGWTWARAALAPREEP